MAISLSISMKIYKERLDMTDIKTKFRLGMLSQRNLFDFNGLLLDQMRKAALRPGNGLSFAKVSVG